MAERSGCLKFLGPLAEILAVKDQPDTGHVNDKPDTRHVETESGIKTQLTDNEPDEFAEGIARAFLTKKPTFSYFDEETGKFVVKEIE